MTPLQQLHTTVYTRYKNGETVHDLSLEYKRDPWVIREWIASGRRSKPPLSLVPLGVVPDSWLAMLESCQRAKKANDAV